MPRRKRAKPNKRKLREFQRQLDAINYRIVAGTETEDDWRVRNGLINLIKLERRRGARNLSDYGQKGLPSW